MMKIKLKYCHSRIFFLILFSALLTNGTTAQVFNRKFNSGIIRANLEFKMPSDFSEKDSTGIKMACWDYHAPLASIIYTIVNQDSSIIIGFFTLSGNKYSQGHTSVDNIMIRKNYYQDTTAIKPIVHTLEYARSAFNADAAVEYSQSCVKTISGYNNIRIVSIANKVLGEGNIVYFYKDSVKPFIDKFIQGNSSMLRFRTK